jgi:predicted negative regulator of RcsB-dependent stress response
MAKHPNAPHRAAEDPDDRFVAGVMAGGDWFKRNSRTVTIAAIALFILVAGSLYWIRYQRALREAASAELSAIRQTIATGNTPLALRDLSAFLESFSDTPSGRDGSLMMAQLLLLEGRNEEALDAVYELSRDLNDPLGASAARLAAAAHEQAERWEEAEAEYLRISTDAARRFERNRALADAGRVRMQRGDAAGAAELYRRALDAFPENDPQVPLLRLRLGEAQAEAQAQAGA